MPVRTLLLLATLLLSLLGPTAEAKPPILIARVTDRPPASWQQNGTWEGMNIEIYQALAKESGLSLSFIDLPWSRALESIKSGECTIMAELSKAGERSAFMHFLGPYATEEMALVVRKEDLGLQVDNLQMLLTQIRARGLQIGIQRNVYYGEEFNLRLERDPAFRDSFNFNRSTLAEMMKKGRLLAFIEQRHVAVHQIRRDPEFANLAIHPFTIHRAPLYLGVSKTVPPELLARLEQATAKLIANGTFAAIESKWKSQ